MKLGAPIEGYEHSCFEIIPTLHVSVTGIVWEPF